MLRRVSRLAPDRLAFVVYWVLGIFVHRAALYIDQLEGAARRFTFVLFLSVPVVGLLVFKYFDFAVNTTIDIFGLGAFPDSLIRISKSIVLPIAISFTALQSSGYLIDVYVRKYPPTRAC